MNYVITYRCPVCGKDQSYNEVCCFCHSKSRLITVGRKSCEIIIDNISVSKHHLDIIFTQSERDEFYTIINYGINGTVVDGIILKRNERVVLKNITSPIQVLCGSCILEWDRIENILNCASRHNIALPCSTQIPSETVPDAPSNPITDIIRFITKPFTLVASCVQTVIKKTKKVPKKRIDSFCPSFVSSDNLYVYSSIFAPAEIKRKSHLQIQVYLHLYEEVEKVKSFAKESDKNAERRDYIPLSLKLKKGDKVDVEFAVYGETCLMSECKSVIWQGSITKCSFDYYVPKDIQEEELSCKALLRVNGVPVGEMRFITNIVTNPMDLNTEIISRKYNKVFISYAHQDEIQVKYLAEGFRMMNTDYFFDRHYLKAGDIFPEKIKDYINQADLFILCWSENAARSEYVEKERSQAMERLSLRLNRLIRQHCQYIP